MAHMAGGQPLSVPSSGMVKLHAGRSLPAVAVFIWKSETGKLCSSLVSCLGTRGRTVWFQVIHAGRTYLCPAALAALSNISTHLLSL